MDLKPNECKKCIAAGRSEDQKNSVEAEVHTVLPNRDVIYLCKCGLIWAKIKQASDYNPRREKEDEMFCMKCHNDLSECICPDIDERMENLRSVPHLVLTFCKKCGKHIERCKCKPITIPDTGEEGKNE